jgi:hypothetical protein
LLPDGIWEVELTRGDLLDAGSPRDGALAGVYRWTFDGPRARISVDFERSDDIQCDADASPVSEGVRLEYRPGPCGGEVDLLTWTLDSDGLRFSLLETNAGFAGNKAYLEAMPWQSVADDASLSW